MDVRALATDGVVLVDGAVVLLERNHEPHQGSWVLPGGLVEPHERAHQACTREVREEIGIDVEPVSFVGLYDAPDRDERGNVSAAYLCRPVDAEAEPYPREEARRVKQFSPTDLPAMGFDHETIVTEATTLQPCG